ncbi:MAG: ABC transporter permease [Acidimicrobiales bacterium]
MNARYVTRRLLQLIPALGAIMLVTFALTFVSPGDPAVAIAGPEADPAILAEVRRQLGLDDPLRVQLARYATDLIRADLGDSFLLGRPVRSLIAERLPATLLLTSSALVVSSFLGILLGRAAARRSSRGLDGLVTVTTLWGYAIPSFWLGQILILVFGLHLNLFPVLGMTSDRVQLTGIKYVLDVAWHLALPVVVLAISEIALLARLTRSGVARQLNSNYARSARAKGLTDSDVLARHAFRNAALPLVTIIGARIGFLFSGAVIIETVFSWPGIGLLLRDAASSGDRPLALGLVLTASVAVLIANLLTDLAAARVDPRLRYR